MEIKKCSDLSNAELKLYMASLENEFEAIKAKIKEMCNELAKLENAYNDAQIEIKTRTNII